MKYTLIAAVVWAAFAACLALPARAQSATETETTWTSRLVTLFAALLGFVGAALVFAPVTVGSFAAQPASGQPLFVQLFGAALVGLAAANWLARHSPLGGIYGRAVVAGTQTFSVIGALILVSSMPDEPNTGYWLLLGILIGTAILYSVLLFRAARLEKA